MSANIQIKLASTSLGRVTLHLIALSKDHHFAWHMKGILREFPIK